MKKQWKQKTWFQAPNGTKGSNKLVAELAGVSITTVNNVFNNPKKVLSETIEKVLEVVKNLDYTPNELPTMKMCTVCKIVKPFKDFDHGYKAKKQRYVTNKKYPHSRCRDCDRAKVKVYIKNNKDRVRKQMLARRRFREYGLTEEEYNNMILSQNNLCAICKKPSNRTLHIDHNHVTGRIRGLLCSKCNTGLGIFNEDINSLANAIKYLNP